MSWRSSGPEAGDRLDAIATLLALALSRHKARVLATNLSDFNMLRDFSTGLRSGSERGSDVETQPGESG